MKILSIDPGDIESAYCIIDSETYKPIEFGKIKNNEIFDIMKNFEGYQMAIEMIASYRNASRSNSI